MAVVIIEISAVMDYFVDVNIMKLQVPLERVICINCGR